MLVATCLLLSCQEVIHDLIIAVCVIIVWDYVCADSNGLGLEIEGTSLQVLGLRSLKSVVGGISIWHNPHLCLSNISLVLANITSAYTFGNNRPAEQCGKLSVILTFALFVELQS